MTSEELLSLIKFDKWGVKKGYGVLNVKDETNHIKDCKFNHDLKIVRDIEEIQENIIRERTLASKVI